MRAQEKILVFYLRGASLYRWYDVGQEVGVLARFTPSMRDTQLLEPRSFWNNLEEPKDFLVLRPTPSEDQHLMRLLCR